MERNQVNVHQSSNYQRQFIHDLTRFVFILAFENENHTRTIYLKPKAANFSIQIGFKRVFNFFSPFYAPPGEIRNNSLVAPELEIATEYQNTFVTNYMFLQAFVNNSENASAGDDDVLIDIGEEIAMAADIDGLINLVTDKLTGGEISDALRTEIAGMLALIPQTDATLRAAEAIYLVVTSPEFAYQR